MLNAKAISIISERYHGKTRIQMLGFRGSAEVVGASILTLAVGQLLAFGWTATFLAYAAGLVVLVLFLLFVPYNKEEIHESKHQTEEAAKLTRSMLQLIFFLAIAAAVIVCTNTAITFRIPSLMIEAGFGDAQLSSLVLSAMQLIGDSSWNQLFFPDFDLQGKTSIGRWCHFWYRANHHCSFPITLGGGCGFYPRRICL